MSKKSIRDIYPMNDGKAEKSLATLDYAKLEKRVMNKAVSAPLEVAAKQVLTLEKVLTPHESWLAKRSLIPAAIPDASQVVVAIRELIDTAEKGRKTLTAPLIELKREIDSAYKEFTVRADKVDDHVSKLIVVADAQARADARAEAEKTAKYLERKGAQQVAQDLREAAATSSAIGGEGLTTFTVVTCKVNDLKALCAAIGAGSFPVDLVTPAQGKLNALTRAGMVPPGCERIETTDVKRTA